MDIKVGGVGGILSVRERLSIRNPQLNEPCQTRVCQSHMNTIFGQNWDIHEKKKCFGK